MCFVTDCSLYVLMFLSKLLLVLFYTWILPSIWGRNFVNCEDRTDILNLTKLSISYIMWEKGFNESKQLMISEMITKTKATNFCNKSRTFCSPIHTFSLAGNTNAHTPIQATNREKYLKRIICKEKCRLWREIITSPSISFLIGCVFSNFRQKKVRV